MKLRISSKALASAGAFAVLFGSTGVAGALPVTGSTTVDSSSTTAIQAQHLQRLQTRANAEIERRLNKLNSLNSLISSTQKLSSSDKATLTAEVNDAISGLTTLKTKIDGDTDLTTAIIDAKSIVTEYRVYALVVPKVHVLAAADNQLTVEDKLTTLLNKFQTRTNAAKSQGKEVTAIQAAIDDMQQKIAAAKSISTSVNSKVLPLQPTDYNADHALLSGYRSQLVTAHTDNKAAYEDAKTIVKDLKNL